jgi:hypothetical protein
MFELRYEVQTRLLLRCLPESVSLQDLNIRRSRGAVDAAREPDASSDLDDVSNSFFGHSP